MKLNTTYKLKDYKGFVEQPGGEFMNRTIADEIMTHGGTIVPLEFDSANDLIRWRYGKGSEEGVHDGRGYISSEEFVYFEIISGPEIVTHHEIGDCTVHTVYTEESRKRDMFVWNTHNDIRIASRGECIDITPSDIDLLIGLLTRLKEEI
ncbi:MAG: hypothetical protein [Caudoviricetes sp.]|nr:MAG: hypothetical protein [Caudoviricetes sp.]